MSARRYRIVVERELGSRYASALDGTTVSARNDTTELPGPIIDSAHLERLVERIAGLGLTLHSLAPLDTEADAEPHPQPSRGQRPRPRHYFEGTVKA